MDFYFGIIFYSFELLYKIYKVFASPCYLLIFIYYIYIFLFIKRLFNRNEVKRNPHIYYIILESIKIFSIFTKKVDMLVGMQFQYKSGILGYTFRKCKSE